MVPPSIRRFATSLLLAATACASGPAAVPEGVTPASVLDGVYTSAQAERGAAQYAEACSACHAADLRGNSNAPSLLGLSFLFVWETRSLDELFTTIRTRMPTNAPNSLTATTYVDIVAYILEVNGFPPGAGELGPDQKVLGEITITGS
jgi:mono/diheme cytochrome c family protein